MSSQSPSIQLVDLEAKIEAINPAYLDEMHCGSRYGARLQNVHYCRADKRLYLIYADAFVFYTDDDCATLHEVHELNHDAGGLAIAGKQFVDAVVDTLRGTVLLFGRDYREGDLVGTAWRKERGEHAFRRVICTWPAWKSGKSGNAAAGFFGAGATDMVALAIYGAPAHLYFSLDDGLSFRKQELADVFLEHVHQVYLPRATNLQRTARLWVSGGDDPTGERSGVVTFNGLAPDGNLSGMQWVMHERPGYRLVGLAGNGKHVFVGNESVAGGVIKILDNQQTFDLQDFEYALGKSRHDYHQFRSLLATPDGWLVSGTDSYAFTGDTVRADSGGYLYMSNDGGASYREISLATKWCTSVTTDDRSFWLTTSMNREDGMDANDRRMTLLKVEKPSAFVPLGGTTIVKAVIVDSSAFYEMAGYAVHPRARLEPGEYTLRADLSACRSIVADIETYSAGTLVVEGLPFETWHPDENPWCVAATVVFQSAGRQRVLLDETATHNRHFRVRNVGDATVELRLVALIGKSGGSRESTPSQD